MKFKWNPTLYNDQHDFVHNFGDEVVNLLNPQKDDVILDLGCGTGDLTKKISSSCKEVIGIDSSLEMIQVAGRKYHEISFYHMDAEDLDINITFDAVFSNAVLHWIVEPELIVQNINRHLKVGGRFVAEFGGKGCVKKIISTLTDVLDSKRVSYPAIGDSLYYPSISEYSKLLEENGFEVSLAMLFDRPTELKGGLEGMRNFIEMFFTWLFDNVSEQEKMEYIALVEKRLKDELLHESTWIADYRRIRILAKKISDY